MGEDRTIDLTLLLTRSGMESSSERREQVLVVFRESFFELRRTHKAAYVKQVVESHYLSHRELGGLLGYGPRSGGAINGAMDGKISDDKFDLLRATVARQIRSLPRWPSLSEFTAFALMRTVTHLKYERQPQQERRTMTREELECLERMLSIAWREIFGGEGTGNLAASWPALLRDVHRVAGTQQLQTFEDIARTITEWGPWYLLCKQAIPGLET